VWDEFELKAGAPTTKLSMTGSMITAGMLLRGRDTWVKTPTEWQAQYTQFTLQEANLLDPNRIRYFPEYMEKNASLTVQPTMTFQSHPIGISHHWQDWSQPLYQADPSDPGLRWNVIRYENGL
jgi:hypothetical protein